MNHLPAVYDFLRHAFKHPKVKRAFWVAAGFAAIDCLVLAAFWLPAALRHHQMQKSIEDYRTTKLEGERARETAERYGLLVKRVKVLETKWQTPASQSGLVESLTRLAAKNGLRVLSQDFNEKAAKGGGQCLTQSISLAGSYPSLRGFIAGLESLPTLTVVEQVKLERAGEAENGTRAILKLATYHRAAQAGGP